MNINRKRFLNNILILIIVLLVGAGVYIVSTKRPLKYYIVEPQNQKLGDMANLHFLPEDKQAKVNEAGPIITFTLQKPDGSKLTAKNSLNQFSIPECPPPPQGISSTCGSGIWVAGGGIIFETFPYYDQVGQYTITASDSRVRGTSFQISEKKDLQLGYLLTDVNGYYKAEISEDIADGSTTNKESFIGAFYRTQEDPFRELHVDVFAETSSADADKHFNQSARLYPKVMFEGQVIAVANNPSIYYAAEWVSGTYDIRVTTDSGSAEDVLRAYLKKYPSTLSLR